MPDAVQPPRPPAAAKPWWRSRTLWFNALCAALAAAQAGYGLLQPLLPVNAYAVLAFALPLGNAVLRVRTTQPLSNPNFPPATTPPP